MWRVPVVWDMLYPMRNIVWDMLYLMRNDVEGLRTTSFRLIIPLSFPGRRVPIFSPTTFTSVQFSSVQFSSVQFSSAQFSSSEILKGHQRVALRGYS